MSLYFSKTILRQYINCLIKPYKTLSYFCYDAVELVTEEQVGFFWLEPAEGATII